MKIEIWSDFACPYCYLGKRRLELALNQYKNKEGIELIYRSYELDPNAQNHYHGNIFEYISHKYDISLDESKRMHQELANQGKDLDLHFNFENLIRTNTFDAHRLLQYAKTINKMNEFEERIFKAYFVDGLNISDHKTLITLSEEVELNKKEVEKILNSSLFSKEVRDDEELAQKLLIKGVPHFIIDNTYYVSGAQSSENFLKLLNNIN